MQSILRLTRENISNEIGKYITSVRSIHLPELGGDIIRALRSLKRNPVSSGPYPEVSVFEAANRIFSDLVIFFAVQNLLRTSAVGRVLLPFSQYEVRLGVTGGSDVTAAEGTQRLKGEAFNVAPSFFQTKRREALKKLQQEDGSQYLLIMFNADAVKKPQEYVKRSKPQELYLPIDIDDCLEKISDS